MKKLSIKNISLSLLFLTLIGGGVLYFTYTAQGVNRTWDCGGGDSSWDNNLNWSGDTEPGVSDIAIFDTTCTNNATIDKNISVAGITISTGYTGTITQSSTFTVTVGSSHYSQADGTFTGGSGTIDINGTFTLSGGTFTSTGGTFEVGYTTSTGATFFTVSGGTFVHNDGTVNFNPRNTHTNTDQTFTIDVATTLTLYNIIVAASRQYTITYLTTGSGDTIVAANDFTHSDGTLRGSWEVQGNVIIGSGADGGSGTVTYTATGAHTYAYTAGGIGPYMRINHAGATVSAAGGTTALNVNLFSVLAGTFVAPSGTMTVGRSTNASETIFTVSSGTTFTHNSGTVVLSPFDTHTSIPHTFTIDVDTSLTLYNIDIDGSGQYEIPTIVPGSGDIIVVANNFTHTDGILSGTWQVQGNYTVATTADGGTAGINFTGGNNQIYTDQGGNEPNGDVTVNKTPGSSVRLAGNADWNAASQDLTITSGELNMGTSSNLSTTALTVSTDGHLSNNGTGDLTLAGNVSNSGNIRFMSNGTCGGTDDISIASSTGVQRTWSGSGTYLFHDVTVQDQGGSAAITAYSSTSTSGNGVNWTFSGAACPAQAPAASVSSGVINVQSGSWQVR